MFKERQGSQCDCNRTRGEVIDKVSKVTGCPILQGLMACLKRVVTRVVVKRITLAAAIYKKKTEERRHRQNMETGGFCNNSGKA